ncbi:MAG TPA: cysteine hydrolase [Syntrophaceae bacterium]|nr:cysteine hydrolase [Syntrophaceae bacterium]
MPKKALIIVDMLKDFIEEGGSLSLGERAQAIIPFIAETLENMRKEGAVIIFVADSHQENDREFERFPRHCVEGTKGAEIIDSLKVEPGDHMVRKRRFSAFYGTNMEKILKDEGIDEAYIVGVCTSICVMETVGDLRDRDYKVYVLRRGVADLDEEAHEFALKRMEKILGAKII